LVHHEQRLSPTTFAAGVTFTMSPKSWLTVAYGFGDFVPAISKPQTLSLGL
jgi:hypothetical protein